MIDELGVQRHTFSRERLESLYRELDHFIADCTRDEYQKEIKHFIGIKTLLHTRIKQTK